MGPTRIFLFSVTLHVIYTQARYIPNNSANDGSGKCRLWCIFYRLGMNWDIMAYWVVMCKCAPFCRYYKVCFCCAESTVLVIVQYTPWPSLPSTHQSMLKPDFSYDSTNVLASWGYRRPPTQCVEHYSKKLHERCIVRQTSRTVYTPVVFNILYGRSVTQGSQQEDLLGNTVKIETLQP